MLVRTTEKIKETVLLNKNMSFDTIKPFVRVVEQTILLQVIGIGLYNHLDQAITNTSLLPIEEELLSLLCPFISSMTIYQAAPQLNIHISEMGFQELRSREGTSSSADLIKYNDARISLWRVADEYRELAYKFLQQNKADFPLWTSSSAYSEYNKLFVRNATEMQQFVSMVASTGAYLALNRHLKISEDKYILPMIGKDFANEIKDKRKDNQVLTAAELELLEYIQSASSWLALYEAAPTLRAILQEGMLITAVPTETTKMFSPMSREELVELQLSAKGNADLYLSLLKQHLDENAASFSTYFNSSSFKSHKGEYSIPCNQGKKSFRLN